MRIGIDISQVAYEGTGVGNYIKNLVENLIHLDRENEYILFFSSLRRNFQFSPQGHLSPESGTIFNLQSNAKIKVKQYKLPPTILDLLWNRLHIAPIEWFIGDVDVFISSDWTQPPTKAKKVTILYDLIVYTYPEETHNKSEFNLRKLLISPNIVAAQKRRLYWVKKECDKILCISKATKKDAMEILRIPEEKLSVIYPGT